MFTYFIAMIAVTYSQGFADRKARRYINSAVEQIYWISVSYIFLIEILHNVHTVNCCQLHRNAMRIDYKLFK